MKNKNLSKKIVKLQNRNLYLTSIITMVIADGQVMGIDNTVKLCIDKLKNIPHL